MKTKHFLLCAIAVIVTLITSCTINEKTNEIEFTWLFWVLLILFLCMIIKAFVENSKSEKENKEKRMKMGIKLSDFIDSGSYVGGHPDINDSIEKTCLILKKNYIDICKTTGGFDSVKLGIEFPNSISATIPYENIEDVSIEDKSQIQNKITAGRLLLVGVFALAWRKKKIQEMQFVVIKWVSGKFENETSFMFEGKGAMSKANFLRNSIIKAVNDFDERVKDTDTVEE